MTNWLDNVIGYFSPRTKARRLYARMALGEAEKQLRKYEGASGGRRMSAWRTPGTSANAEIAAALTTLRSRARDLGRNNCYAKRGISVIKANTVGTGIITQIKGRSAKKAIELDALFDSWAEETCVDYDGRNDIYGLQNLIIGTVAESGECLIRLRRPSKEDMKNGMPVPLQLQVLEGDFLDSSMLPVKAQNGNRIIQGIEFDSTGRRVAYHLAEEHPGEISYSGAKFKLNRVDAREVFHVYDITRPGQVRGVPWLAPAILKLRDLDEFEDAQLIRQKIASCFAAFVQDSDFSGELSSTTSSTALGEKVEPGLIEHLPPGKEISFANPPGVTGYKEYISTHLMAISSALGITYEAMTGDLSQVNFSSARMGWLEFQRNITDWQQRLMVAQFLRPLWRWFSDSAVLMGYNVTELRPMFTMPRREMIDPTKEIPALIKGIRAGLFTQQQAIMSMGGDPVKQLEEIAETNKLIDKLGLTLDSDPRKTKESGDPKVEVKDDEEDPSA